MSARTTSKITSKNDLKELSLTSTPLDTGVFTTNVERHVGDARTHPKEVGTMVRHVIALHYSPRWTQVYPMLRRSLGFSPMGGGPVKNSCRS